MVRLSISDKQGTKDHKIYNPRSNKIKTKKNKNYLVIFADPRCVFGPFLVAFQGSQEDAHKFAEDERERQGFRRDDYDNDYIFVVEGEEEEEEELILP